MKIEIIFPNYIYKRSKTEKGDRFVVLGIVLVYALGFWCTILTPPLVQLYCNIISGLPVYASTKSMSNIVGIRSTALFSSGIWEINVKLLECKYWCSPRPGYVLKELWNYFLFILFLNSNKMKSFCMRNMTKSLLEYHLSQVRFLFEFSKPSTIALFEQYIWLKTTVNF